MRMGAIAANRRRSAGAAWTPASYFIGGVDGAYWDASDLSSMIKGGGDGSAPVTTNGDPVGQINDKSGNGYHLLNMTSDTWRPTYTTGGGAGGASPYLDFDGSSSGMSTAGFAAKSQPNFIAIAVKFDSTGAGNTICDGVAFGNRHVMNRNAAGSFDINAGSNAATGHTPGTTDRVLAAQFNTTSSVGYMDGVAGSTVSCGTNPITGLTIGCDRVGGLILDGRIYAAIWIPGTPDATLRANILTWLGSKQGRTL